MKMIRIVIGSTISRRWFARFWLAYSPSQSIVYPTGNFTCSFTFLIASSTVLPRSRPRTLYLIAT